MSWVLATHSMIGGSQALSVVTGKPIALGGSVGREAATGRGVMNILRKFLSTQNKTLENIRVAVQGFGNVGYHTAQLLTSAAPLSSPSANEAAAFTTKTESTSPLPGFITAKMERSSIFPAPSPS